jgi:hypothetical protein
MGRKSLGKHYVLLCLENLYGFGSNQCENQNIFRVILNLPFLKDFFSTFSQWVSFSFEDIILHEILSIEWTKFYSS